MYSKVIICQILYGVLSWPGHIFYKAENLVLWKDGWKLGKTCLHGLFYMMSTWS